MKKIIIWLSCSLTACIAAAQSKHAEEQIRKMDQHNAAALVDNDTVALKKYLTPNFLLNTSGNRSLREVDRLYPPLARGGSVMRNLK